MKTVSLIYPLQFCVPRVSDETRSVGLQYQDVPQSEQCSAFPHRYALSPLLLFFIEGFYFSVTSSAVHWSVCVCMCLCVRILSTFGYAFHEKLSVTLC